MSIKKVNTGVHEMQEAHEEKECLVNEKPHNHPETDCGHFVDAGPGTVPVGDLNLYDVDHGKKAVVSGGPKHNLDQDVEHGPGVE